MQPTLFQSLQSAIEEWANARGLCASVLGSEIAGGLTLNLTVLPESAYRLLYQQYAEGLGYPPEALGAELMLEEGHRAVVLGLDPVGEIPLLIVQSGESRFHLPKAVFDRIWPG